MSLFSRFGGRTRAAPTPQAAVAKINSTVDMIHKRIAYLERRVAKETQAARGCLKRDRRQAAMHIKRRRMFDAEIQRLHSSAFNLESQVWALQGSIMNQEVLAATTVAVETMQGMNLDADAADEVLGDVAIAIEDANSIGELIAEPLFNDIDDDEIAAELEEIEAQLLFEEHGIESSVGVGMPSLGNAATTTATATTTTVARASVDDEEEAALEAEIARWVAEAEAEDRRAGSASDDEDDGVRAMLAA